MRYRLALTFLLAIAATGSAQDRMTDTLRKGIVEEESRQNLSAAIQHYEAVMAQFNDSRATAATALFRMAECYRKQGKGPEAMAAYQRVAHEFADQSKLAEQSRTILTGTYHVAGAEAGMEAEKRQQGKVAEARERYRNTIIEEMNLVRIEIQKAAQHQSAGSVPESEVDHLRVKLIQLERDLAAFDAGMTSASAR